MKIMSMDTKKPSKKNERRFTERFHIPEGITYFRYHKRFNLITNFIGPFPMYDIASNSARFECSREIKIQSEIELKIRPPGYHDELRIKGKVIKRAGNRSNQVNGYVIQFNPFGKGFQYNTLQCRTKLQHYIQTMKAKKRAG